jgi:hypothetical protein
VTGGWRKLHSEEFYYFNSSPNIIRVIRSWDMTRTGHAEYMGENINTYKVSVRKPEGNRPIARPKIILKWILRKLHWRVRIKFIWLTIRTVVELLRPR